MFVVSIIMIGVPISKFSDPNKDFELYGDFVSGF